MADTGRRTARLRRTFRYPSDNDSEPEALDEQEQETLIKTLGSENARRNKSFCRALLSLPLLSVIAYLPLLPSLSALLGISSLLSTAFLLYILPPTTTGISALDTLVPVSSSLAKGPTPASSSKPGANITPATGPLETWLPYLNLALVLLTALAMKGGLLGVLPGILYGAIVVAKKTMGSVDPEELSSLKYRYKGA